MGYCRPPLTPSLSSPLSLLVSSLVSRKDSSSVSSQCKMTSSQKPLLVTPSLVPHRTLGSPSLEHWQPFTAQNEGIYLPPPHGELLAGEDQESPILCSQVLARCLAYSI